jgi:hypothetical protein
MKRTFLLLSLWLGWASGVAGQSLPVNLKQDSEAARAFSFFAQLETQNFDEYLRRARLPRVSEAFKAEVLAQLPRNETVEATANQLRKLAVLEPLLRYHERAGVIEIRVIRERGAFIRLQGRAVLVITEAALTLLSAEELQAVVAHELGHEYFWGELMEARRQKAHATIREIELRCDGIALIALRRLGMEPARLLTATSRLRLYNTRVVSTDPFYHPTKDERQRFNQAMDELVRTRQAVLSIKTSQSDSTANPFRP